MGKNPAAAVVKTLSMVAYMGRRLVTLVNVTLTTLTYPHSIELRSCRCAMLVLAVAMLAVAQNDMSDTTDNDNEIFACERGLHLTEPACLSAYSITDSRYCLIIDGLCISLYKCYQRFCNTVNLPSRSYTDFRDWNVTFQIESNVNDKLEGCTEIIMGIETPDDDHFTPDERDQITAACSQMCVASDDSEDDNQLGLILGLSLGLGLPAIGVLIYFLVIRPNQKKNGTRNAVDTEPLM